MICAESIRSYLNSIIPFIAIDSIIHTASSIRKLSGVSGNALPFNFYLAHIITHLVTFFCREISRSYRCLPGSFSSAKNHYRQIESFNRRSTPSRRFRVRQMYARRDKSRASCAFLFVHVPIRTFCNYSFETSSRCSTLVPVQTLVRFVDGISRILSDYIVPSYF